MKNKLEVIGYEINTKVIDNEDCVSLTNLEITHEVELLHMLI